MSSQWFKARVSASRPAAEGLWEVDLDVSGTPLAGTHRVPGQYVRLAVDGRGEAFFAIASAPGEDVDTFELLVKGGSPLADAVRALPAGATLSISAVQGRGFPIERARGRNVLLFATGSGISPVRSLIGSILRDRGAYGRVTLYFGARHPDAFAYARELDQWGAEGIHVVRTVSQPGDSGWQGLTGYVQTHVPDEPLGTAVAFLCGQKGMVEGVTEALVRQGLPRESIFLNY